VVTLPVKRFCQTISLGCRESQLPTDRAADAMARYFAEIGAGPLVV